jgi:hypothetical protein
MLALRSVEQKDWLAAVDTWHATLSLPLHAEASTK